MEANWTIYSNLIKDISFFLSLYYNDSNRRNMWIRKEEYYERTKKNV